MAVIDTKKDEVVQRIKVGTGPGGGQTGPGMAFRQGSAFGICVDPFWWFSP
ncbi:MAG: hypothetical protein RDV48_13065 [Candidatus Eremiobacteraeota bacterium]|nr:hypothetical protein [Candidatus Eremiobacteraeota bacterium]